MDFLRGLIHIITYTTVLFTTSPHTFTNSLPRVRIPCFRQILHCYGWQCWCCELRLSLAAYELKVHVSLLLPSPRRLQWAAARLPHGQLSIHLGSGAVPQPSHVAMVGRV